MEVKCRVVGLHSLFIGDDARGERHVVFCDLDRSEHKRDPMKEPKAFRMAVRQVMMKHNLGTAYLFQTLKGVHVVSPDLVSRRAAEAFEEDLEDWGSDGFHRFMGYKNGGTVIRVTPKPGEGSIKYLGTIRTQVGTFWSGPHYDFLAQLHPIPEPVGVRRDGSGEVRLEAYDTVARSA